MPSTFHLSRMDTVDVTNVTSGMKALPVDHQQLDPSLGQFLEAVKLETKKKPRVSDSSDMLSSN